MPITRGKKEELVAEYTDKFSRSRAIYLTDYRGLTVSEITDLRKQLRENGNEVEYTVAKNTLLALALERAGFPVPEELLVGPTAVAFVYDEPVAPAKALSRYADTNEKLQIRGGILGATILNTAAVKDLAALPGRDVLLAILLGNIQGPALSLVNTIMAPLREIAYILAQRGQEAGGADEVAAEA
ncbi:MAG: 50S ribosomal protein L10 [Ardenticatenaceae bacterium]|nr:50S ribosomal protein L10 [Ardenticatenaceae bacterium]